MIHTNTYVIVNMLSVMKEDAKLVMDKCAIRIRGRCIVEHILHRMSKISAVFLRDVWSIICTTTRSS